MKSEGNLEMAAYKSWMDAKTARKYRRVGSKANVSLGDFAEDSWIVFQKSAYTVFYRTLINQATSLGISIHELHHILTPQEVVHMVNSG